MRTLIPFILIMLAMTSFSNAQSGDQMKGKLIAKASTKTSSTAHIISSNMPIWENSVSSQSRDTERIYRAELNTDTFDPVSTEQKEGSADVSLAIINELKLDSHSELKYESPALKTEDLPLVMSSADKKTTSVVLPPFLYFKKQF